MSENRREAAQQLGVRPLRTRRLPVMVPWFSPRDLWDYARRVRSEEPPAHSIARLERALEEDGLATNPTVVSRGRDALRGLLRVCGAPGRCRVIVPAYTDRSVWDTVVASGLTPVPVDVSPRDCNMTSATVAEAVDSDTAAVIPTHLFGHPADVPAILRVAGAVGAPVIEDAAHALGATLRGQVCGSFGAGAFSSFAPFKVVQAHGGGVVWSAEADTAVELRGALGTSRRYRATVAPLKILGHAGASAMLSTRLYDWVTHPATRVALALEADPKRMYKQFVRPLLKHRADTGAPFSAYQADLAVRQVRTTGDRLARRRAIATSVRSATEDVCFLTRATPDAQSAELMLVTYARAPTRALRRLYAEGIGALRSPMANLYPLRGRADTSSNAAWVARHAVVLPLHDGLTERHVGMLVDALRTLRAEWIDPHHERLAAP